jgi:hypothetical protein
LTALFGFAAEFSRSHAQMTDLHPERPSTGHFVNQKAAKVITTTRSKADCPSWGSKKFSSGTDFAVTFPHVR